MRVTAQSMAGVSEDGAVLDDPVAATQPLSKSVCYVCVSVCSFLSSLVCVFCVVSQDGAVLEDPVAATQPLSKSVCYVYNPCVVCVSSLVVECSVW